MRHKRSALIALLLFSSSLLAASLEESLWAKGCGFNNFAAAVLKPVADHRSCNSFPLAVDVPSVLLGLAASASVYLYFEYRARLETLNQELRVTHLTGAGTPDLVTFSPRLRSSSGRLVLIVLVAIVSALGLWFHGQVERSYPLSQFLSQRASTLTPSQLQVVWWARSENVWSAATWIIVGCAGAVASLLHARLHVRLSARLRRLERSYITRFISRYDDRHHGWKPFSGLIMITTLGAANFSIAMGSIGFMVVGPRGSQFGTVVLAGFVMVGLVSNLLLLLTLRRFVLRSYERALEAEIEAERRGHEEPVPRRPRWRRGGKSQTRTVDPLRLDMLDQQRGFPIKGFWRRGPAVTLLVLTNLGLLLQVSQWLF